MTLGAMIQVYAQDNTMAKQQQEQPKPIDNEVGKLKLQLMTQQIKVLQLQYQALLTEFNDSPKVKALAEQAGKLTNDSNALAQTLFDEAKLDKNEYRINLDNGTFVKAEKQGQ